MHASIGFVLAAALLMVQPGSPAAAVPERPPALATPALDARAAPVAAANPAPPRAPAVSRAGTGPSGAARHLAAARASAGGSRHGAMLSVHRVAGVRGANVFRRAAMWPLLRVPTVEALPEPEDWMMLMCGVFVAGFIARRRIRGPAG